MKHSGLSQQTKKEILDLAEKWWEQTGRHLVRAEINMRQGAPTVMHKQIFGGNRSDRMPIPTVVTKPAPEPDIDDGILLARPWEELKGEEQARIMFEYFSNIWLPAHPEVKLQRRMH